MNLSEQYNIHLDLMAGTREDEECPECGCSPCECEEWEDEGEEYPEDAA